MPEEVAEPRDEPRCCRPQVCAPGWPTDDIIETSPPWERTAGTGPRAHLVRDKQGTAGSRFTPWAESRCLPADVTELSPPLHSDNTTYQALDACKALLSLQHALTLSTECTAFQQLHTVCVITPPPPFVICLMGKSTPRRCPEAMHWKMGRKSQSAVLTKGVINSLVKSSHNNANTHYPLQIQFCAINISRRSAKCSTNIISFNAINENKPGELSRDSLTVARRSTSRFETWTLLHLTDLFFLRALVSKTEKSSTGAGRETPACSLRDAGGPAPASSLGERLRKHLSPHLPPAVPPSSPFLLPANVSTLCPIAASGRECSCELHPA